MAIKSERLKKLESEVTDLEQWLKLGLVPNKDIEKHKAEIEALKGKVEEEHKRLKFLKETGELEEYVTPRKQPARTQYTESPSLPDTEATEENSRTTTSETVTTENTTEEGTAEETVAEETATEDDYFSDKNRWKRGLLHPDEDEW